MTSSTLVFASSIARAFFAEEYKAWIMCSNNPTNTMDFTTFHTFWETAVKIASVTATPALENVYGMNAVEDNSSAASLTNTVSNFGTAYAAIERISCPDKFVSLEILIL
jgi:hypothetical protein